MGGMVRFGIQVAIFLLLATLGVWLLGWAWGITLPLLIVLIVDAVWASLTERTRDP